MHLGVVVLDPARHCADHYGRQQQATIPQGLGKRRWQDPLLEQHRIEVFAAAIQRRHRIASRIDRLQLDASIPEPLPTGLGQKRIADQRSNRESRFAHRPRQLGRTPGNPMLTKGRP